MDTPEFVGWTLACECPLREVLDEPASPMAVERLLRPIQAYSQAAADGRIFEGVCVAPNATDPGVVPLGFRADEVLAAYGGLEMVQSCCRGCPANAAEPSGPPDLAGCVGLLHFDPHEDSLYADFEDAFQEWTAEHKALSATTQPAWYGVWRDPSPNPKRLEWLRGLLAVLADRRAFYAKRLLLFRTAIDRALEHGLSLHVELFPRGQIEGRMWRLVEHCPDCKAPWESGRRRCVVCDRRGGSQASRKRHARGERPYWRLAGFLGEANVEPFLARYRTACPDRLG